MTEKPIEMQGIPIEIEVRHDGYYAKSFPTIIDLWEPEKFLKQKCVQRHGDEFMVICKNGIATYFIVKKIKIGKHVSWWVARRTHMKFPHNLPH